MGCRVPASLEKERATPMRLRAELKGSTFTHFDPSRTCRGARGSRVCSHTECIVTPTVLYSYQVCSDSNTAVLFPSIQ